MCSDFSLNKSAVRTKNCSLNMPADRPSAPGCRTDGAINRCCMGSVSATSGPDTELQVPDEILQNFGMKTCFSKDVPKLPNMSTVVLSYSLASSVEDISCSHARKNRMKTLSFDTFGTPLQ